MDTTVLCRLSGVEFRYLLRKRITARGDRFGWVHLHLYKFGRYVEPAYISRRPSVGLHNVIV